MKRLHRGLLSAGLLLTTVTTAYGQQPDSWWHRWKLDYHRNHCWPDPFVAPDRAAVNLPFIIMADNGWRRQNLLGEVNFEGANNVLNESGQHRLWWILTQAPVSRRTVFVQRGASPQITAARIDAVEQALVRMVPNGALPPVLESNLDQGGWSGEDANSAIAGFNKSTPEPRMPAPNPTSISSGGAN